MRIKVYDSVSTSGADSRGTVLFSMMYGRKEGLA